MPGPKPVRKKDPNAYPLGEKLGDIAKWTWEGMTKDIKNAVNKGLKWGEKKSKELDDATQIPGLKDAIIRPNPKQIDDNIATEEEFGITRGKKKPKVGK